MSMILELTTVSDDTIDRLMACSQWVWFVVADPEEAAELLGMPVQKPGFLGRLFGKKPAEPPVLPPDGFGRGPGEGIKTDLDKAWHGIHFLLTGSDWEGEPPWCYLVRGGRPVGNIDVGYGPARALSAAEVRNWAAALATLPPAGVRERFNAEALTANDIYPSIWDADPEEDDVLGYLEAYYVALQAYVATATEKGMGLLVAIT